MGIQQGCYLINIIKSKKTWMCMRLRVLLQWKVLTNCPFPGPEPVFRTGIHWMKMYPGNHALRSLGRRNLQHYGKYRPQWSLSAFPKEPVVFFSGGWTLRKGNNAVILRAIRHRLWVNIEIQRLRESSWPLFKVEAYGSQSLAYSVYWFYGTTW